MSRVSSTYSRVNTGDDGGEEERRRIDDLLLKTNRLMDVSINISEELEGQKAEINEMVSTT